MKVAGSRKGLLGSLAAWPGDITSGQSRPVAVRDRRTLWLICNTLDVEPRTVSAGWMFVVRDVSLAAQKPKCSLVEVPALAGNLGECADGGRERSCCGEQRFKMDHGGGEKRWYSGLDAGVK